MLYFLQMAFTDTSDFNPNMEPQPIVIQPLPDALMPHILAAEDHESEAFVTTTLAAEDHDSEAFVITTLGSASVLHDHPYAVNAESADDQGTESQICIVFSI